MIRKPKTAKYNYVYLPEKFDKRMLPLMLNGYNPASLEKYIEHLLSNGNLPNNSVVIWHK